MVMKMLRKKAKLFLAITACLIVPAFILWGGATALREQRRANFAGTMSGRRISWDEYNKVLTGLQVQARLVYGDKFASVYEYLNLNEEAWNKLILLKEAARKKIRVSDEEVVAQIQAMPFFAIDGGFSRQAYEYILKYNLGQDARAFEEQMRDNLKVAKLIESIQNEVSVSEEEAREEYKKENELAKISYILAAPQEFEGSVAIVDADLERYYKAHTDEFMLPEEVNVEYIAVEYEGGEMPARSEQEARHIANEISDFLVQTPDLASAAQKFSLPLKKTGYFSQGASVAGLGRIDELNKTAFELSAGQASDMIKTPRAYYFISPKDKRPARLAQFAEVRGEVKDALVKERSRELARQKIDEHSKNLKEALAKGNASFKGAAASLSLSVKEPPPFAKREPIEALGSAPELNYAVFKLKAGEMTNPVQTEAGYVIAYLDQTIPADEAQVKDEAKLDEFKKRLLARKKMEHFNNWFIALKEKANIKSNIEQTSK